MIIQRIQRKRTKGWKMPENTIYVGRGSKWGNPFYVKSGYYGDNYGYEIFCDRRYKIIGQWLNSVAPCKPSNEELIRLFIEYRLPLLDVTALKGKDLACWCSLDEPCHGNILLHIANQESERTNG